MYRDLAVGFSIGNKGYVGTGLDINGQTKNDFWEYDPTFDVWTQKKYFGYVGGGACFAVGFSIGNRGYIGLGAFNYEDAFWEYDTTTNNWTQKVNFTGTPRSRAVGFSIGNKGYIGTGWDIYYQKRNDFWEYTPNSIGIIKKELLSTINVFPNPAKAEITVSSEQKFNNVTLKLVNVLGQTLFEKTNLFGNNFNFNISDKASGIYFIEINENGIISRIKLLKE